MILSCDTFPQEMCLDRESTVEDATKAQLGKLMGSLRLLKGVLVRSYLQDYKCWVESLPSMGDSSQKLETWSSLHNLQAA